jgi:hypothetical protein
MGIYNGKTSVHVYIRRIQLRVNEYGERKVLAVLPLCMRDAAGEWYESIDDEVHDRLMVSVEEWCAQLRLRFQLNPIEAEQRANRLKHNFGREDILDVKQYITKKHSLLREAGYRGPSVIYRIWRDLDPLLMGIVSYEDTTTLEQFTQEVYKRIHPAKLQYYRQFGHPAGSRPYSNPQADENEPRRARYAPRGFPPRAPLNTAGSQANIPRSRESGAAFPLNAKDGGKWDPPNQKAGEVQAGTSQRSPVKPPRRPRYPCTLCGNPDHTDGEHRRLHAKQVNYIEPINHAEEIEDLSDSETLDHEPSSMRDYLLDSDTEK